MIGRVVLLSLWLSLSQSNPDRGKCSTCRFLVETFQQGLKNTANQHFAGGDTAWEEKNLGKYATSETRLIEVLEGVCKRRTLSNTDKYSSVKELEFKCAHLLEENEETLERWYYNSQERPLEGWLCNDALRICCPSGHYGSSCEACPGVLEEAKPCFGRGACEGEGTRSGSGKCKCEKGYQGLMCRLCDSGYYAKQKTEISIECEECFVGCAGGCSGPSASECSACRAGYRRDEVDACIDVDECADPDLKACTKENEQCVNTAGSFRCDCAEGFLRNENTRECELDIKARPPEPLMRPDLLLRCISLLGLFGCVLLVVSRPSALLLVLTAVAVVLFILIELYVNPDAVPHQLKRHFEL